MQSFLKLDSFKIYNIILLIVFCIIVNPLYGFTFFYLSIYCIFHFLLIYLGIYHYKKILYLLYFFYGLGLDILLFNEIGPHLFVFMITLVMVKSFLKYLYILKYFQIYVLLLFSQIVMIFFEVLLLFIFFNISFNTIYLSQMFFISTILSYPLFILFYKIDQIK